MSASAETAAHCPFGRTVLDGHDPAERFECPSCGLRRKPLVEQRGARGEAKRTVVVFPTHYPQAVEGGSHGPVGRADVDPDTRADPAHDRRVPDRPGSRRSLKSSSQRTPRPDLGRGDRVIVAEPGIAEWQGHVLSVKRGATAWIVEVRNDDHLAWAVPAQLVRGA